jgi:hypothetical protein
MRGIKSDPQKLEWSAEIYEVWIYSGPLVTRWMAMILLNQSGTHSSNRGRCFGNERPSAAAGSHWWSTPAAGGVIRGACWRHPEEGRRGSNLIEIGSYGGGTVRITHLGAPWV